jgi:hypothetical protein
MQILSVARRIQGPRGAVSAPEASAQNDDREGYKHRWANSGKAAERNTVGWVSKNYEECQKRNEKPEYSSLFTSQQSAAHLVSCEKGDRDCERSQIVGKGIGCREQHRRRQYGRL